MTREQAQAIIAHLDLIRHFADGGDIAHKLIDCNGNHVRTTVCRNIVLSNLRPDHTNYVRVKARITYENGMWIRRARCFTENIPDSEILK